MCHVICENWLHLMWTYFHQGVQNCFETMPTINIFGQAEFNALFRVKKQCFADLMTAHYNQFNNRQVAV